MINLYKNKLINFFGNKLLTAIVCVIVCITQGNAQGTWTALTTSAPHYNEGEMTLLTDGTVLCKTSSGGTSYGTMWDRLTPDAHGSYIHGTWTTIAAMANERLYFSTQVLNDGRLYVAGGEYGAGGDKGEVYNPLTNTWTACPQIVFSHNISDANSEILANGKVLQAVVDTGGTRLNYLWDPASNTYTQTASCLRGDNEAVWVKLPDGSVIFIDNYSTTSERYIPATNTWVNDASLPDELYDPYGSEAGAGFMLPDGRAFFIGSTPTTAYYTPSGSASAGTWAAGPAIPGSQGAPDAASTMMPNGKILMALSPTPSSGDHFPDTIVYYEFSYLTNAFTQVSAPYGGLIDDNPAFVSNMLMLPDGTILYANQGDDQYFEYTPGSGALGAGQPTLDSVLRINCDTFMATGLLFNGISEGAAYGDDWQMSTNYPIIKFTSGTNVYYTRTYGWNRIGAVATGAALDTTMFVIPAGMPAGTYTVQVVVNGNPSNNKTYNTSLAITPASSSLCAGDTSTLTDAATIGVWSSTNTAAGTINPATGALTGIAAGTTIISCSIGACFSIAHVTVNTMPSAITPSGGLNLCVGSNVTLNSTPATGAWSSSAPLTAGIGSSSGIASGISGGIATISYTLAGCSATEAVTVNALPVPVITPSGPVTFCAGDNVVLNSSAGLSYQWLSAGSAIAGATDASYTTSATGNYAVTMSNAAGCQATSGITAVTVNTAPGAAITAAGPTAFCGGASVVLNANTGVGLTYQWQSGGTVIAGETNSSYTATTAGNYAVTVANAVGCADTSAITAVTVNAAATAVITAAGATTFCAGSSVVLNANTGIGLTYQWLNGATAIAGETNYSYTATTSGSYVVAVTNAVGCSATSGITTVIANAAPVAVITAAGPTTFCTGSDVVLNANTGVGLTYQWLSGGIVIAGATNSFYTATTAGNYVVTVGNAAGCSVTSAITAVIVNSVPSAIITPAGVTTFCAGSSVVLNANIGVGFSYQWQNGGTAIAGATDASYTAVLGGSYTVVVTNSSGCSHTSPAIAVTVNSAAGAITGVMSVCSGTTTTLSDGPAGTWSSSNVAIAPVGATTGVVTGIGAGGPATITYTLATGCIATAVVTVNPVTSPLISGPSSVCSGQTISLTDGTPGGTWSSSAPAYGTIDVTGVVTGVSAGVTNISYVIVSSCVRTIKSITINALPVVAPISGTFTTCSGTTSILGDVTPSGVWSSSNASVATVSATGIATGVAVGLDTISYTVTTLAGCTNLASAVFNVSPSAYAAVAPAGPVSFCTGGYVLLNAPVASGLTYQWKKYGVNIFGATSSAYTANATGDYTVFVTEAGGCYGTSAPVTVTVSPPPAYIVTPSVVIAASAGPVFCGATSPAIFTANPTNGGAAPTFQWFVNGVAMGTGTTYSYTPAAGNVVKVVMASDAACAFPLTVSGSDTISIGTSVTPSVSINANPATICSGNTVTFSAIPIFGGTAPVYRWDKNGVYNVWSGPDYIYMPVTGDILFVTLLSNYPCAVPDSARSASYHVNTTADVLNTISVSATRPGIVAGSVDTFIAIAPHGGTSPVFQWLLNGSPITGATSSIYVTGTLAEGDVIKCEETSDAPCVAPLTVTSSAISVKVIPVGVQQITSDGDNFRLVPNPNKGSFTIEGSLKDHSENNVRIIITDMLGQTIYTQIAEAHNGSLNLPVVLDNKIADGMYLVTITSGDDHVVYYMVINR